ncbi:MAG: alanine racemase [Proteobacteria bacterium]|nr:alanine racemase [Pseudomonadota bacterium]
MAISPDRGTCWAEVDLEAVRSNFRFARSLLPPGTPMLPVVKADAYGHGAVPVSRVLEEEGAGALLVATVDEGAELRKGGIESSILILGRMTRSEIDAALRWRCEISIPCPEMAQGVSKAAVRKGITAPVHIKVDTGMTRLGIPWETASKEIARIARLPGLKILGVFTHFANADLGDREFTRIQRERFQTIRAELGESNVTALFHMANSAGILTAQGAEGTGARPGIMLYGSPPSHIVSSRGLSPVLSWKCRVLQVHEVPAGTGISYGHDYITKRPSRIATISAGYADGYPRSLANKGQVLLHGRRAPVRGRITMDMTMVDVTDIPEAGPGDEVILIGRQGEETISASELASWAGTISYEIFCGISHRVKRLYLHSQETRVQSPRARVESSGFRENQ